jgi:hypothetical protein
MTRIDLGIAKLGEDTPLGEPIVSPERFRARLEWCHRSVSLFGAFAGDWNGLEVRCTSGERIAVSGRGAGRWPTTEAVTADIFEFVRARAQSRIGRWPIPQSLGHTY